MTVYFDPISTTGAHYMLNYKASTGIYVNIWSYMCSSHVNDTLFIRKKNA